MEFFSGILHKETVTSPRLLHRGHHRFGWVNQRRWRGCSQASESLGLGGVCRKTVERGILLGTYTEGDFAKWRKRGVGYMSVKNDTNALLEGLRSAKAKAETCA